MVWAAIYLTRRSAPKKHHRQDKLNGDIGNPECIASAVIDELNSHDGVNGAEDGSDDCSL